VVLVSGCGVVFDVLSGLVQQLLAAPAPIGQLACKVRTKLDKLSMIVLPMLFHHLHVPLIF
jgi:hypothetical protein